MKRGHDLVVIASEHQNVKNVKEINIQNKALEIWHQKFGVNLPNIYERDNQLDSIAITRQILVALYENVDTMFGYWKVQELFRNLHEKFDLI